jgi:hypothetical protein
METCEGDDGTRNVQKCHRQMKGISIIVERNGRRSRLTSQLLRLDRISKYDG